MSHNSYKDLKEHYNQMFELFDRVHFNSSLSEAIYRERLDIGESTIAHITHSDIVDRRVRREFISQKLNLIFIGDSAPYKGYSLLERVLLDIYSRGGEGFELDVWGFKAKSPCSAIRYNGRYSSSEMSRVFAKDSLLVVPSICYETFGLVVLEALSFGVPVMVSSTVGAKDIVENIDPWFVFTNEEDLQSKMLELIEDRERLVRFNRQLLQAECGFSLEEHCKKIFKLYNR